MYICFIERIGDSTYGFVNVVYTHELVCTVTVRPFHMIRDDLYFTLYIV